jgi:peptide/nickel transport system ATP-binding protein
VSDSAGPPPLEVSDLRVRIAPRGPDVVSEVSFTVQAGQVLGLVGESGAGKTTVALALLGHCRRGLAASGQVRLAGTDLLALRPARLRERRGSQVSYVAQDPAAALNPALRVGTQLREALRAHRAGDDTGRVAQVLAEVRLDSPEILGRYPHQLSGGQQQRVGLAMAFACRPAVIVLDEPTTGLDVSTQRHVLETVRRLCRASGAAAVYVSHDLAVVSGLASHVAVMYAGRIVELGPAAALFGQPRHPYTRALLAAVPSPDRAEVLAGIDGRPPRPGHHPPGCSFAPRCALAAGQCRAAPPPPVLIAGSSVRCLRAVEPPAQPAALAGSRLRLIGGPVPGDGPPVLAVRQVSASYGRRPALAGVTLTVAPDSCAAVVGESGAGKTTLARCIAGLHRDWTGEIEFQGRPLATAARRRPVEVLRRVQYIFQNPYTSLSPRQTAGQIVAQPLERFTRLTARQRRERAAEALADVRLGPECLGRYPDQLSGGERQRVAIARALVAEPDLLICDEVTSSLDVSVQAVIVELLRRIQRERHLAMIFITHDLALVRNIAQSAVVLRQGAVVESGPVARVLDHPASTYTASLMADVPRLGAGHRDPGPDAALK